MNKKVLAILAAVIFTVSAASTVYAHPGRTDDNGGHWDYSSDTYHYHHGYPEHQHYDMDGDGIVDCPYDFDDKTGQNSGTSGNSGNGASKDEDTDNSLLHIGLIAAAIVIVVLAVKLKGKCDDVELYKGRWHSSKREVSELTALANRKSAELYDKTRELERANHRIETLSDALFVADKRYYALLYEGKTREEIANAPDGCFIGEDELPYTKTGCDDLHKWGDFTVFMSSKGRCYHSVFGCSGANVPINAVNLPNGLRRCAKCSIKDFDLTWYNKYRQIKRIIDKYSITLAD